MPCSLTLLKHLEVCLVAAQPRFRLRHFAGRRGAPRSQFAERCERLRSGLLFCPCLVDLAAKGVALLGRAAGPQRFLAGNRAGQRSPRLCQAGLRVGAIHGQQQLALGNRVAFVHIHGPD